MSQQVIEQLIRTIIYGTSDGFKPIVSIPICILVGDTRDKIRDSLIDNIWMIRHDIWQDLFSGSEVVAGMIHKICNHKHHSAFILHGRMFDIGREVRSGMRIGLNKSISFGNRY